MMKKITSLTLGLSFLIMTYTGIMLFLCPKGKIAYWSDWELLGLTKAQYGDLHITSMIVMLLFGILHIYYNWKPLMHYMQSSAKKITFTKKEFLIAFGLNLFVVVGTLTLIEPFKAYIDFNDYIKNSWEQKLGTPPYGHAEESKLKVLCRKTGIDLEAAKERLKQKGISFDENESLKTIAKNNNVSPNDIYSVIKAEKALSGHPKKTQNIPAQLGRKTLRELSDLGKINLEKSIELLRSKGLQDTGNESIMKNIADELGLRPIEVYNLIKR